MEATAIPDVLFERGLYWASGRSGVVNLVAAHKWFNLAALKGRADAISMRREVAAMMSDAEIADRAARSPRVDDRALISAVSTDKVTLNSQAAAGANNRLRGCLYMGI